MEARQFRYAHPNITHGASRPRFSAYPEDKREDSMQRAFTLIELLIVVAIIAILAAIAVPNFLEAQTRAKVSRVKADMRSVASAVESYHVDTNHYPPPYGVSVQGRDSLSVLSTPVAYITAAKVIDPFAGLNPTINKVALTYEAMNGSHQIIETGPRAPFSVAPTDPAGAPTVWWWVASRGPTRSFSGFGSNPNPSIEQAIYEADQKPGPWLGMVYDPTNGTVSRGNIYRAGGEVSGFAGQTMLR
jgi:prepilin-type N-terminal cleavage/methylation domain-containing protein